MARRALGIVETIIHLTTYLVEVIGNHPRNQIEIVGQILSHF
jgi:hypothetical protein